MLQLFRTNLFHCYRPATAAKAFLNQKRPPFITASIIRMSTSTTATVKDMTPVELNQLIRKQHKDDPCRKHLKLIDARERHEIESFGRIESASNIPHTIFMNDIDTYSAALNEYEKDSTVNYYL